ncbi:MAG: 2-oxo acid dehydrogenase subunit E2 [Rubripirellula sp.]|nr:2-oxo acid dehydrogenase subunit E2 [Rubripirellula sp.]
MSTEVKLPELGDGIEAGDVLEIFVAVGDVISEGQDIVEMETDKATVPVPASVGGKVTKILVSEGDTVAIGGALLEVEATAVSAPVAPKPDAPKPDAPKPDAPKPDAPKPDTQPAPPATPEPVATTPAPVDPAPVEVQPTASVIPAGPAIRRFAREVGVDLSQVPGSGDDGRITREDVLSVVRSASQTARATTTVPASTATAAPNPTTAAKPLPGTADVDNFGPIRVERMSKIRKTISRQMHASWSTVPRVTNFDDADITDLEHLRQCSKEDYAAQGLKLTTMPFLIKAVATALRHNPAINAVIDQENEQLIYKDYVNIGIAVDTDRGLVVPVMNKADTMGIPEVTRGLAEMAGKVRGGNFGINDLKGGTFTISNLGTIGGQYSTPIVNIPEVAILLVGRSRKLPVVMPDDSIQPRLVMPLSLSYDHRLVDGATAARFLNDVIGYLEAPSRLLLAL